MRAVKGNKEYVIEEAQKKSYQDAGFDIYSNNGNIIAYGRGKTVPYEDYAALKAENEQYKARIAELEEAAKEPIQESAEQSVAANKAKKAGQKAGE
ncbi:MAG: hypothetical protein J6J86_03550 [Lachnospiraceae bacterium]|nr:hypothetical protein [Roseburia sp.]MBP3543284.1 hypothetical protein [Lachnospiraceae bacterium]